MADERETFKPPETVAAAGAASLRARAKSPPSLRGMTPVGIRRAAQLSNRQPVSLATLRRMLGYLSRHLVDKRGKTWPEKGPGWQAWHAWGGDAGARWAARIVKSSDPDWFAAWSSKPRNAALMRHVKR